MPAHSIWNIEDEPCSMRAMTIAIGGFRAVRVTWHFPLQWNDLPGDEAAGAFLQVAQVVADLEDHPVAARGARVSPWV